MNAILRACTLSVFVAACCTGCGSPTKAAKAKAEAVHPGMTLGETEAILGTGETKSTTFVRDNSQRVAATVATWSEGKARIVVTFVADKVTTVAVTEQ